MSSRERWVVYPLLFLTLGMTMRDKVWPQHHLVVTDMTAFGKISCNQLEVTDMTAFGKISCNQLEVTEVTAGKTICNQLEVGEAECRMMTLTGRNGRDVIRLGAAPSGTGRVELLAADGSVLVTLGGDEAGKSGRVETFANGGVPQTQLRSTEAGGVVTAVGRDQDIWLILGHYDDQYGVFAASAKVGRRMPLTLPWRFETSLPEDVPADGPVEEEKPVQ